MARFSHYTAHTYLPGPRTGKAIALCLGGSGLRSIPFQLGAIRRLNEVGLLSKVNAISGVSAGSLVAAALAAAWPRLEINSAGVFGNLNRLIHEPLGRLAQTRLPLEGSTWERWMPWNWGKARRGEWTAANQLANILDKKLFRGMTLGDLPEKPAFVLGAAELRTGTLWEFRRGVIRQSLFGEIRARRRRVADAVAAALADPITIDPIIMRFQPESFDRGALDLAADLYREKILLTDAAARDPLATEPVWRNHHFLLVVDGGQRLPLDPEYRDWLGDRLARSLIMARHAIHEQQKRWLIASFVSGHHDGLYVGVGTYHGHFGLSGSVGYPADIVDSLAQLPADLDPVGGQAVMALENHGYTLTDTACRRHLTTLVSKFGTVELPHPRYVERGQVLAGIGETLAQAPKSAA